MHAHVYLWRHALKTVERIQPAVAPEYALKLRTASAICRVSFCAATAYTRTTATLQLTAAPECALRLAHRSH